ncbi:hypothetical protein PP175_25495 (plasmid) [Aneurinibacillus sp. Ricciae_BoGa-3]|uniref:hypothetical protein n=1 Tax=Aneurinibacillus sp. Ricciae_BoGa-3 TaxID=3022697 RepID=UPI002340DBCA|nr:hypothetical protein [Aneurinibacillus sp. Ricciae_BoGa-3]WCK57425.1 hypothetical protein PP175_25495 [Aneurinibacillus sp. Ricciae_BoGa-3]
MKRNENKKGGFYMEEIKVRCIAEDYGNRTLYKNIESEDVYAEVDGRLYTISNEGEPISRLGDDLKVTMVI